MILWYINLAVCNQHVPYAASDWLAVVLIVVLSQMFHSAVKSIKIQLSNIGIQLTSFCNKPKWHSVSILVASYERQRISNHRQLNCLLKKHVQIRNIIVFLHYCAFLEGDGGLRCNKMIMTIHSANTVNEICQVVISMYVYSSVGTSYWRKVELAVILDRMTFAWCNCIMYRRVV